MRSKDDDRDLVRRILAGDASATDEFVNRYRPHFEWVARSRQVPYSDFEDVASEAVADALRQLNRFNWISSLGWWLERIVSGHIVNWFRKRPPPMIELDATPRKSEKRRGEIGTIDQMIVHPSQEVNIRLREILDSMSPRHRMLFILNVICDFKSREIAKRLGLKPGTVGRQIADAKRIFREKLMGREKP